MTLKEGKRSMKMHQGYWGGGRGILAVAAVLWFGMGGNDAAARDFRVNQLPNGSRFRCQNCHVSVNGGGTRNAFGNAVLAITGSSSRAFWSPTLAAADSDGDGFSNGTELGDPEGDGTATAGATVTNPGNSTSKPEVVNQRPQVALTTPAEGANLTVPAVVSFAATASDSDGSVARVDYRVDGLTVGSSTTAPYTFVSELGLGTRALVAVATDDKGLTATSAVVNVTISAAAAPAISSIGVTAGTANLAWTGGGGPFVVQSKAAVTDPWCAASGVGLERAVAVPAQEVAGLLRVADLAGQSGISLTATLGGEFERPNPVSGNGTGSAKMVLAGNRLTFEIDYSGLSGAATAAHIHGVAGMDESAGVLIDLAPFNGGAFATSGRLAGSVILTQEQKVGVLSGRTYVNIHTAANPPGEIRGQILPGLYQSVLHGANERPTPNATTGRGHALFQLSGNQLTVHVAYSGLTGVATAAHIHGPADASGSAGVLINLAPLNGGAFGVAGSLVGTVTMSADQLRAVAQGLAYVNIHTEAHLSGEIRGQILPNVSATPFTVNMSGAAERPTPVNTAATGQGLLALEGDTLFFLMRYAGLTGAATAAHFHGPAGIEESAGVLLNLAPFNGGAFGPSGGLAGSVSLTAEQRAHFVAGRVYVNIHTVAHPSGEIRGQAVLTASP